MFHLFVASHDTQDIDIATCYSLFDYAGEHSDSPSAHDAPAVTDSMSDNAVARRVTTICPLLDLVHLARDHFALPPSQVFSYE